MLIIDELLSKPQQQHIENLMLGGGNFAWFYNHSSLDNYEKWDSDKILNWADCSDTVQLNHNFVNLETGLAPSLHWPVIQTLIQALKHHDIWVDSVIRAKANLIVTQDARNSRPHIDQHRQQCCSMVYYVNDSDGDTAIYPEHWPTSEVSQAQYVAPKQGRAVLFASTQWHQAHTPVTARSRAVINMVFESESLAAKLHRGQI